MGVWRNLVFKGVLWELRSGRRWRQQLPEEPSAMVGKALPYRRLCSGEAHGTREPSRRSMLMEVGVKRENVKQVLSDLLDDRGRKM